MYHIFNCSYFWLVGLQGVLIFFKLFSVFITHIYTRNQKIPYSTFVGLYHCSQQASVLPSKGHLPMFTDIFVVNY